MIQTLTTPIPDSNYITVEYIYADEYGLPRNVAHHTEELGLGSFFATDGVRHDDQTLHSAIVRALNTVNALHLRVPDHDFTARIMQTHLTFTDADEPVFTTVASFTLDDLANAEVPDALAA